MLLLPRFRFYHLVIFKKLESKPKEIHLSAIFQNLERLKNARLQTSSRTGFIHTVFPLRFWPGGGRAPEIRFARPVSRNRSITNQSLEFQAKIPPLFPNVEKQGGDFCKFSHTPKFPALPAKSPKIPYFTLFFMLIFILHHFGPPQAEIFGILHS